MQISLYLIYYFFIIIVIGVAANKSDLFDKETVPEEEGQKYAEEIGAIFRITSALNGNGVQALFQELLVKFVEQNKDNDKDKDNVIVLNSKKHRKRKRRCCGSKKK